MFKTLLGALGTNSTEVETELFTPGVQPGQPVQGVIRMRCQDRPVRINGVSVELITRAEREYDDREQLIDMAFAQHPVFGPFELHPGHPLEGRFELLAPWETPITFYNGRHLHGTAVAVRTRVDVDGGFDAADTDPLGIGALPPQHVLLAAVESWGFGLRHADVEAGRVDRIPQRLPFFQEIEFGPSPRFPGLNQLEVTFLADPQGMYVVLEADKRAMMFAPGRDVQDAIRVDFATFEQVNWVEVIGQRLHLLAR
ncbi:sporulation protein [Nocardia sp. NPDC058499]|uniref:sporulation protein n=1 Tax=Nocardia sp. NPDC058499 TaxID=3346530 RepID=UPI003654D989